MFNRNTNIWLIINDEKDGFKRIKMKFKFCNPKLFKRNCIESHFAFGNNNTSRCLNFSLFTHF